MQWLAGLLAMLIKDLLPTIVEAISKAFGSVVEWQKDRQAQAEYNKRVADSLESYKKAKTKEEQDAAFENLIGNLRRP